MIDLQNDIPRWRALGRAEPERLTEARLNLHWGVQAVSAVGASYLPPLPDDSHTNLEWLHSQGVLAGNLLPWKRPIRATMRPYDLMLQLRDENLEVISEISIQGMSYEMAIKWMSDQLEGLADTPPSRPLARDPYDLPEHAIAEGGAFAVDTYLLKELALWFSNADLILRSLAEQLDNVSPVRCWPHHFDIGVVIDYGDGRSIGVGMEPGDKYYDEPYWYVRTYPAPQQRELPPLGVGGVWHKKDWTAAIFTGSELVKASPGDKQCRQLEQFLDSALEASLQFLEVPA